jgi:integrase
VSIQVISFYLLSIQAGRSVSGLKWWQPAKRASLKTKASRRTLPADDFVLQAITAHMQRWQPARVQLIIINRLGGPVQRNAFGDRWRPAVASARTCDKPAAAPGRPGLAECREECGLAAHMLPAGTQFHDLRHFYASALIRAGLNPKVIQARLGHATIAETMDTYGHLFHDSHDVGRGRSARCWCRLTCRQCALIQVNSDECAGQRPGGGRVGL